MRSIPELTWHIDKDANRLEEVEAGLEHDVEAVSTEYRDPRRDPWDTVVPTVLQQMSIDQLADAAGMHRRSLFTIRTGER